MRDRRRNKRVSSQLRVWCEGEEFTLLAQTANVSLDGMFVRTAQPPPAGLRLSVEIEELKAAAEVIVRWGRASSGPSRSGAGLEILRMNRGEAAWNRHVEKGSSRSGEHAIAWPPETDPE